MRVGAASVRPALGCERTRVGLAGRPPHLGLACRDGVQLLREPPGALGERRLQPAGGRGGDAKRLVESRGAGDEALEPRRVGAPHRAQMCDRRERLGGSPRALGRLLDAPRGGGGALGEPSDLSGQLAPPGFELEQDGFRGLAGEPELAVAAGPSRCRPR